ncbi:MAG: hypothetical protein AAFP70_11220 [Calditrichota bacterium]
MFELIPTNGDWEQLYRETWTENLALKKDVVFLDWLLKDHMNEYDGSLFSEKISVIAWDIYADENEPDDDVLFWTEYGSAQEDRAKNEPIIAGDPCKGYDIRKGAPVDLPPSVIQKYSCSPIFTVTGV